MRGTYISLLMRRTHIPLRTGGSSVSKQFGRPNLDCKDGRPVPPPNFLPLLRGVAAIAVFTGLMSASRAYGDEGQITQAQMPPAASTTATPHTMQLASASTTCHWALADDVMFLKAPDGTLLIEVPPMDGVGCHADRIVRDGDTQTYPTR